MSSKSFVATLVVFWLGGVVGVATAQTTGDTISVLPVDTLLDPERLVPHRVTWQVTRREPDGGSTVQGLWTDTWVRSTDDVRPVFVFRQLFVDTTGAVLVDNETVFAATFRAIRSTQRLPPNGSQVTYRYAGDTVSGMWQASADTEPRTFQVIFTEPVWEPLAPVSVLLPLERLESAAVIRHPVWNQTGPGSDVTWSVTRIDSVGTVAVEMDARSRHGISPRRSPPLRTRSFGSHSAESSVLLVVRRGPTGTIEGVDAGALAVVGAVTTKTPMCV